MSPREGGRVGTNPKAGLKAAKQAVDMSTPEENHWYWPPEPEETVTTEFDLSYEHEGSWLVVRQDIVGHLIVDFAIMQLHNPFGRYAEDGNTCEVARIDTSHGSCHWHYMDRDGNWARWGRIPIKALYDTTTHYEVNSLYPECYERMLDGWEENLERWRAL